MWWGEREEELRIDRLKLEHECSQRKLYTMGFGDWEGVKPGNHTCVSVVS